MALVWHLVPGRIEAATQRSTPTLRTEITTTANITTPTKNTAHTRISITAQTRSTTRGVLRHGLHGLLPERYAETDTEIRNTTHTQTKYSTRGWVQEESRPRETWIYYSG